MTAMRRVMGLAPTLGGTNACAQCAPGDGVRASLTGRGWTDVASARSLRTCVPCPPHPPPPRTAELDQRAEVPPSAATATSERGSVRRDARGGRGGCRLAQAEALDLARRGLGELVHEMEV